VAALLSVIAGVDPADAATKAGSGRAMNDYTQALKADALKGGTPWHARDFLGQDEDVDWVIESAARGHAQAGRDRGRCQVAEMAARCQRRVLLRDSLSEFVVQIADTSRPPVRSIRRTSRLIERARQVNAPRPDGASPNPGRWTLLMREIEERHLK
jgi:amidase